MFRALLVRVLLADHLHHEGVDVHLLVDGEMLLLTQLLWFLSFLRLPPWPVRLNALVVLDLDLLGLVSCLKKRGLLWVKNSF